MENCDNPMTRFIILALVTLVVSGPAWADNRHLSPDTEPCLNERAVNDTRRLPQLSETGR